MVQYSRIPFRFEVELVSEEQAKHNRKAYSLALKSVQSYLNDSGYTHHEDNEYRSVYHNIGKVYIGCSGRLMYDCIVGSFYVPDNYLESCSDMFHKTYNENKSI